MSARRSRMLAIAIALCVALALAQAARAAERIGDLTAHEGDVPMRLVGYGIVVGLDGTGDRSFGYGTSSTPTVRSVVNLLRRFDIEVPAEQLRLRDVAAVMVTAEASPYLRAGGRFEVSVSAMGDATSLRGGVLWITPLVTDPDQPAVATAQGAVYVAPEDRERAYYGGRHSNAGRISDGGVMESNDHAPPVGRKLVLHHPDYSTATRIAAAVNQTFGAGTARVEDPGSVALEPRAKSPDSLAAFLAGVDTLTLEVNPASRVVIDGHDGTVVAGGDTRIGPATVSHHGFTLDVGGAPPAAAATGLVRVDARSTVQDVAAGLHAAGAKPEEIAAIFEALVAAGALTSQLVVR
ncbi:MAG: flagellar basal body P-ring protein FlgI [Candidatus Eiseniibacteriota bacterium]